MIGIDTLAHTLSLSLCLRFTGSVLFLTSTKIDGRPVLIAISAEAGFHVLTAFPDVKELHLQMSHRIPSNSVWYASLGQWPTERAALELLKTQGEGGDAQRPPPPPLPPVGPNFSHHKARVQALGWLPVGDQETGEQTFCCPPPPGTERVSDPKHPPPRPQVHPSHSSASWHMASEVPRLTEGGRAREVENFGTWDPLGNPAGGPPFPSKWRQRAYERTGRLPLPEDEPPPPPSHFLSVYFFSVSFCPCLPGPLGLDKLQPTSPPSPLTA